MKCTDRVLFTRRNDRCQFWEKGPDWPPHPQLSGSAGLRQRPTWRTVYFWLLCLPAKKLRVMFVWKLPLFFFPLTLVPISPRRRMQPWSLYLSQHQTDFLVCLFFFKCLTHRSCFRQVGSQLAASRGMSVIFSRLESYTIINQLVAYLCSGFEAYFKWHMSVSSVWKSVDVNDFVRSARLYMECLAIFRVEEATHYQVAPYIYIYIIHVLCIYFIYL